MIFDGLTLFTGTAQGNTTGNGFNATTDKLTGGPATVASSNVIDLGMIGGVPAFGGARDIGIGDDPALKISVIVTNSLSSPIAGGTSLQLQLQGAPDSGSGTPGAYYTLWTSPVFPIAALGTPTTNNPVIATQLANIDMPRVPEGQVLPEFLQMNFILLGTFTGGGTIEASIMLDIDDQVLGPTGAYSGFAAGITVAN
jgi:hypothetical protein